MTTSNIPIIKHESTKSLNMIFEKLEIISNPTDVVWLRIEEDTGL